MFAQKSKQRRSLDEEKYSEKFTTHSLIHSIFFLAVSNNHSHPHQNKNTRGASLQHRHLALEVARDHRQPIRSQEVVGAAGEKKCSFTESHSLTENLNQPFEKGTDLLDHPGEPDTDQCWEDTAKL